MMSFSMRVKSAALAITMVASSSTICSEAVVSNAGAGVVSSLVDSMIHNKVVSAVVFAMIIGQIRIMTNRRVTYDYTNWREDVIALLNSYNIFNAKSRATILAFADKYWAGAIVKIEDTTTRTKLDDGSVFTIKGKKLTQVPCGVMGLIDAYVLQQAKKLTDYIVPLAGIYVFIYDPMKHWGLHCDTLSGAKKDNQTGVKAPSSLDVQLEKVCERFLQITSMAPKGA